MVVPWAYSRGWSSCEFLAYSKEFVLVCMAPVIVDIAAIVFCVCYCPLIIFAGTACVIAVLRAFSSRVRSDNYFLCSLM